MKHIKPSQTYEMRIYKLNKRLQQATNIKTIARLTRHIRFITKLHLWGVL